MSYYYEDGNIAIYDISDVYFGDMGIKIGYIVENSEKIDLCEKLLCERYFFSESYDDILKSLIREFKIHELNER